MRTSVAVSLSIGGGVTLAVAAIFIDGLVGSTLFTAPGAALALILNVDERGQAIGVLFLGVFTFYALALFLVLRPFTRPTRKAR